MTNRTLVRSLFAALVVASLALPATAAPKTYTLAQVKTHAKASNCWSVINGSVYNLTKWVNRHPGGSSVIVSMCGRDGSAAFKASHGRQSEPAKALASYLVGKLKK